MKKHNLMVNIFKLITSAVIIFLFFWFTLPPLNPRSSEFWSFIITSIIVCMVVNAFSEILGILKKVKIDNTRGFTVENGVKANFKSMGHPIKFALISIGVIIVFSLLMTAIGSQLFNAKGYNQLLTLDKGNFASDVSELSMTQIPIVDRDTASTLGQRKLGEMSDLVSQFEIASDYTQINYKDKPVRVTPLIYGDVLKWFNNQSKGIPAYIMVDMTTQQTTLVRLDEGIKYSNSEYFMRNLNRYLRFKYPTKIFDNISFEIDDSGTPYWVASTVSFKIALWSGRDVGGAVLVNAVTGESEYFGLKDIPMWVDQVFDSNMVIQQLIYNGKYRSGYFNSMFGQKGVLQPTDGYNYLAIDDDVWLYTGMTSVVSDQSNLGFVLVNLRTKEARYYTCPGAEEYSAMSSAQGMVQDLGYTATFPLLLNVSDRPTYFMSLKDDAGLVKMFAFVDVEKYQIVGTGSSIDEARADYIVKLASEDVEIVASQESVKSGAVEDISSAVVGGNTQYYIKLVNDPSIYTLPITLSDALPFVKVGDTVSITLNVTVDNVTTIKSFKVG